MKTKNCLHCKKEFEAKRKNQICCSTACGILIYHKRHYIPVPFIYEEKNCLYCGLVLKKTRQNWRIFSRKKFCNDTHRTQYDRWGIKEKHMEIYSNRTCLQCGEHFSQEYKRNIGNFKKFCSKSCRHRHSNNKRKDYWKEWYNINIEERRKYNRQKWINKKEEESKEIALLEREGIRLKGGNTTMMGLHEAQVYYIVTLLFPNDKPIRNDRLTLGGLELDVYLPSLKLAFEYMGEYHYHFNADNPWPLKTIEEFEALQWRDKRKRELCKEKGIILIEVKYDEEITPELLLNKLKECDITTKEVKEPI